MLPAKSPNLNAYAERWVQSVKQECLSKLVLVGEGPLQRSLTEFTAHYHLERNHQGKGNKLPPPLPEKKGRKIHCHERLGGLLKSTLAPHEYFCHTGFEIIFSVRGVLCRSGIAMIVTALQRQGPIAHRSPWMLLA
jgi:hypothetical protein